MRKFYLFMTLVVFVMLPFIYIGKSYAQSVDNVKNGNAYIAKGTILKLKSLDTLDSNINQKFDLVNFCLTENFTINGLVIIPKDTQITGMITKIHGSRLLGESAVIRIKLRDYFLPNGKYLKFKDDLKIKGGKNYTGIASSIIVPFSGLLFKGKEIYCPNGSIIDYEFKDNVDLQVPISNIKSLQSHNKTIK